MQHAQHEDDPWNRPGLADTAWAVELQLSYCIVWAQTSASDIVRLPASALGLSQATPDCHFLVPLHERVLQGWIHITARKGCNVV